jgi:hypothetical protein
VADIRDTAPRDPGGSVLLRMNSARGAQSVLAGGLAVLAAAVTTVALRGSDPASADTRVAVARLAQVYLPDGSNHPAVEGEVLPRGAELHTGQGGGAQLTTAGRRVYLGALSTLVVQDGIREELTRGLAMVDARNGAHLDLTTPAGRVSTPGGAVSRVEEGMLTRVVAYDGTVTLHLVGRAASTAVPALHQLKVQPQSLPQRTTPLQLTPGDVWERTVAADLVSADEELNGLADGLALQEGAAYLATVPASFRSGPIPALGTARGEEALTFAVAAAAGVKDPLTKVRADRGDLGSWGVVAALVKAPVTEVSDALSRALAPTTDASGPTTVNAGPTVNLPGAVPTTNPSPGTSPGPGTRPTSRPTSAPTSRPTTSPSPGVVATVVDTVTSLISPTPSPVPNRPVTPLPSPSLQPCLLGAVLC